MALEKITIPAARKMAGLTQKGLGAKCFVSKNTVANWENGRSEPTISQAHMIAEACGVEIGDIIFSPRNTDKP